MTVTLMPHQEKALGKLSNGKILAGGVGSGKSLVALAYYVRYESPKHIYVITTAKKRDSLEWESEAAKYGIGKHEAVPGMGLIIVDSWNNISKYIDVEDAFFIFDEQRLVGTGAWVRNFQKIAKKNKWILLSATPGDTWMDYVPVFVANGLYRNATQFKREHVVYAPFNKYPKIVRYMDVYTLEKYRNMLLVEMPYKRHTVRHFEYVETAYDEELFRRVHKERWHVFQDRPITDVGEMFRVLRRISNADADRVEKLKEIIHKHPKLIVFYNFDYELDILRGLSHYITIAEWNGHKKQPIPDTERWLYLVQYVSGAEGWNCTATDAMAYWSLTYSWKNLEQTQGRIDRINTPYTDLYYYAFWSNHLVDRAIIRSLENKEIFNERAFARTEGIDIR